MRVSRPTDEVTEIARQNWSEMNMPRPVELFLVASSVALISACGGGGSSSASPPSPAPAPAPAPAPSPAPAPPPAPVSASVDRTKTQLLIARSTSTLDGSKTTTLSAPGPDGATFTVYCTSNGNKGYFIQTDFITGSGSVEYRVGTGAVHGEVWSENSAAGFKQLIPNSFDVGLLKSLYKNWEFVTRLQKFGTGYQTVAYRARGFGAAIDQTRADCGWSTEDFPPDNGWGRPYPDAAPPGAKEAIYAVGAKEQFGVKAWIDKNVSGKSQLMIRVGENKALCAGNFVISGERFYVEQGGSRVSAVTGVDFALSCASDLPATFALQGDFNPDAPFVLKVYPFHFSALDPGEPISMVSFP